jgi:hypothetical protein
MPAVTIQGSNGRSLTLDFDTTSNFILARQLAAALNAEIAAGTLVTRSDPGGPPPLPAGANGEFFQTTSGLVTLPSGYTADIISKPGSAIVFGSGATDQTILSGSATDLTFFASGGSGTVVAGGGNNRIFITGTTPPGTTPPGTIPAGTIPAGTIPAGTTQPGGAARRDNTARADRDEVRADDDDRGHGSIDPGRGRDDDHDRDSGHGDDDDHGHQGHGNGNGNGNGGGGDGGGPSTPGAAAGNWVLFTGDGNDVISALGAVNATIGAGGGHNGIVLGSGQDVIISTGDDSIQGGSGTATIDATGAHSSFIQGMAADLLFVGGSGGATILGGSGSDTYFGSTAGPVGDQLVKGGSAGNNFLFAGDGLATLSGGGNNDQLFSFGSSGQMLIAAGGNETLSAALSSGDNTLRAGAGRDLLIGGTGADTFVGGSGNATVSAGSGADVFAFINHQAGGTDLVQGIIDPAGIKIALEGYGGGAIAKALASQTVSQGSVTIGLSDGTKITFQDVISLNRSNFI